MRLAWRNLSHDRLRFSVTIVGIVFAVFLMVFQGSLLAGFVRASSKVIDATDAQIWIAARGVNCFEFPAPIPSRFRELAQGVPGVAAVRRIVAGSTSWQTPSGLRQTVIVVGADAGIGDRFPLPYLNRRPDALHPEMVLVDQSNAPSLEVISAPVDVEISRRRARVAGIIDGFGSFIGSPYVFTTYNDAAHYLGLEREETMFLLVSVSPEYEVEAVRRNLQARLPEVDVWTREAFSQRARLYWVNQTGSGGALLLAGLLGFLVGLVIVSQTIYSTTMDNLEEFATLKAIGASRRYIRGVVLTQSLVSGVIGSIIGLLITFPLMRAMQGSISWIYTPWWLPVGMIAVSLVMCCIASVVSIRKAVTVEPGRVFRA